MPRINPIVGVSFTIALVVSLAGCASASDRLTEQLARAQSFIEVAEREGALEYSPASLQRAREKLARAHTLADSGDHEVASRLATEAELDAQFSAAQADRLKAERSLQEINQSLETLRRETSQGRDI